MIDAISTLLSYAVDLFSQAKGNRDHRCNNNSLNIKIAWAAWGLVKTGLTEYPVIHARVNSPEIEIALQSGRWFLGRSDHDWDQYPYVH